MSFPPRRFLELAEEIFRSEWPPRLQDAALRTVISRAYYAAFLAARERLEQEQVVAPWGTNSHEFVIRTLCEAVDPERRKAGGWLDSLRTYRNQADYDVDVQPAELVHLALEQARRIVRVVG